MLRALKARRKGSGNGSGDELRRLRARLAEAEETLDAIRKGEVDAITVEGPHGAQVFTLQSADLPYRTLVERMNEGAASMNAEGVILFCNERLAEILRTLPEKLVGTPLSASIVPAEKETFEQLLARGLLNEARGEVQLQGQDGRIVPVQVSLKAAPGEGERGVCLVATDLSERKRNEEQSRIREQSLMLALQAGHSGTFDWEFEPNVVRWSAESEEVYGLPVGGFGGHYEDWERMVLPEDVEIPRADIREARRSGEYSSEFRIRRQNDGAIRWVHARGKVFFAGDGRPVRMVGTNTDTTERKRAEETSRASRRRMEAVLDGLPVMVCLLTPEHDVAFANRNFRARFGEARGRKCYEYCFGKNEPCEFCETFKVLRTNAPHDWELTMWDGQRLHAFDSPFRDADGSPLILEMNLDVSEQKQAEEALRRASRYMRSLIEASLDPLVTISAEGKITDVNEATEAAAGVSREKLIASDFSDYFTEPDKAREGYQKAFEQGSVRDYPLAIRHASGRITDVLYNATVYKNEAGEVQGVFAAARDVTDRKAAEEALEQKAQELARSNEELSQFAYVASHDLQEPLRKIVAFGDRLVAHSEAALDEQGRDYLQRMQNAAKRMGQLIESLLDLSRVTTKGEPFETVDLNGVLSEVLADLEVRIQQIGGRVEVGPLPAILADRLQMRQLFQNLIGNALKFHQENVPPVVQISAERTDGAWEIHVADNGIGFDEKYADRIFRPFQRLHGKNVFEGSGMGLAICNRIMARHAGQITAHSQPGRGSDFVLTLPATPKAREASAR